MSASQILLAGHGPEDRWLTESPNRTYFEAKYQPHINRLRETFEVPFDNQGTTFGTTGICTIPVKGDYLTALTLRAVFPPIYPTVPGQYVFPTPSSQVGGTVYVNKNLTQVIAANGVTLTANTVGNHYFSVDSDVTLVGTGTLDGTFTIVSIPTANSFTCLSASTGTSTVGTASSIGILSSDAVGYFSTESSNLWVNNLTNKTWQITGGSITGTTGTFTTSEPSNLPVGTQVVLNLPGSGVVNLVATVLSSTDVVFTCNGIMYPIFATETQYYSIDGFVWKPPPSNTIVPSSVMTTGDGFFLADGGDYNNPIIIRSNDGKFWYTISNTIISGTPFIRNSLGFGNGIFVMSGYHISQNPNYMVYSSDQGITWSLATSPNVSIDSIAYGNGTFVGVSNAGRQLYSEDDGLSWVFADTEITSYAWRSVVFSQGRFIAVGSSQIYGSANGTQIYSDDNGHTWQVVTTPVISAWWAVAANGNGNLVAVDNASFAGLSQNIMAYSNNNGLTWYPAVTHVNGDFVHLVYGNGLYIGFSGAGANIYSTDGGINWTEDDISTTFAYYKETFSYTFSSSDSVSLLNPPLALTNRVFSSDVYPSISFANAADAAFWGFDSRGGLTYSLPATPPWTFIQSGWITGFLPPSLSTYDDSVAHKLCKAVRILVGKQTIKEYSGEYIELQNDLTTSYENKAILKLLNGTLDQTQATVERQYYVSLPIGAREIPLCALTHQNMSVEITFESPQNLSQNLNLGTGDLLDSKSYLTYDASAEILNGLPMNVMDTLSYQQYIFTITYGGIIIVYDTTKPNDDQNSYTIISAFVGSTGLFKQFCVLGGILYIQLINGFLIRGLLEEFLQKNTSSFGSNNYLPSLLPGDIVSSTGTMIADARYIYYAMSNLASNAFIVRYDTESIFEELVGYTAVNFTETFNSSVTGFYQILSTGNELIAFPQGTPGVLYTYQLNANVQSQWYALNYYSYGTQITEGVLIGSSVYFVLDRFKILKYSNSEFTIVFQNNSTTVIRTYIGGSNLYYSDSSGITWNQSVAPASSTQYPYYPVAYGNGIFTGGNIYSTDGITWNYTTNPPTIENGIVIGYGNGIFVKIGEYTQWYSEDGLTWTEVEDPIVLINALNSGVAYGNGIFIVVTSGNQLVSYSEDGLTWISTGTYLTSGGKIAFGDGVFIVNSGYYSTDGITWTPPDTLINGQDIAYGNGVFVIIPSSSSEPSLYSTNNGVTWQESTQQTNCNNDRLTYVNGIFVSSGYFSDVKYSRDFGLTWSISESSVFTFDVKMASNDESDIFPFNAGTSGFRNLLVVGNYIYFSTDQGAGRFDTSNFEYEYPSPVLPGGKYIFANGPRYVFMFSQDPSQMTAPTNIVRFDPYPTNMVLKSSIIIDYESLPEGVKKPDKALLPLVQTQRVTDMNYMNIKGPVKELWVTGASDAENVFQYSNLAALSTLEITGEQIVTEDIGTHTFLTTIEPFETHTSMPIRNFSVVPFEFDPESAVPNGTINFSRIRDQKFDGDAQTVWARTYNLLKIQGGIGGLIFDS